MSTSSKRSTSTRVSPPPPHPPPPPSPLTTHHLRTTPPLRPPHPLMMSHHHTPLHTALMGQARHPRRLWWLSLPPHLLKVSLKRLLLKTAPRQVIAATPSLLTPC